MPDFFWPNLVTFIEVKVSIFSVKCGKVKVKVDRNRNSKVEISKKELGSTVTTYFYFVTIQHWRFLTSFVLRAREARIRMT